MTWEELGTIRLTLSSMRNNIPHVDKFSTYVASHPLFLRPEGKDGYIGSRMSSGGESKK
jgi:hypothetical protein